MHGIIHPNIPKICVLYTDHGGTTQVMGKKNPYRIVLMTLPQELGKSLKHFDDGTFFGDVHPSMVEFLILATMIPIFFIVV